MGVWPLAPPASQLVVVRADAEAAAVAFALGLVSGRQPVELVFIRDPTATQPVSGGGVTADADALPAGSRLVVVDACEAVVERRGCPNSPAGPGETLARAFLAGSVPPARRPRCPAASHPLRSAFGRHLAYLMDVARVGRAPWVTIAFVMVLVSFFAAFHLLGARWSVATLVGAGAFRANAPLSSAWSTFWTCVVWHETWRDLVVNAFAVLLAGTLCEWFIGARRTALLLVVAPAAIGLILTTFSTHRGVSVGASAVHYCLQGAVLGTFAVRRPWPLAGWAFVAILVTVGLNVSVDAYHALAGVPPQVVSARMTQTVGFSVHLLGAAVGLVFGFIASLLPRDGPFRWLDWAAFGGATALCVASFCAQAGA
jgi:hypothetical protein